MAVRAMQLHPRSRPASPVDAIVLAAGRATRMWPLCTETPKPLVQLGGRPLLAHLLDRLASCGIRRAVLVVPPEHTKFRTTLDGQHPGLDLVYAVQAEATGTGGALAAAAPHLARNTDGAVVAMGDSLVSTATLGQLATAKPDEFVVAAAPVPDVSRYGHLQAAQGRLTGITEKPPAGGPGLANTGFYHLPAATIQKARDIGKSPRGELELTDLLAAALHPGNATGEGVRVVDAAGWLDIGRPWDLLDALGTHVSAALDHALPPGARQGGPGTIEPGVHIRGRVWVSAGAILKAGTYIEGDCWIGPDSTIGPNAYLRGPVETGAQCKIGAGCEAKASLLQHGAHVPHLSYVGDSILGEHTNLGAGTQTANLRHDARTIKVDHKGTRTDTGRRKLGAIVGDRAKTGINTTLNVGTILPPGHLAPPGSVVGVAARPHGQTSPAPAAKP